MKMRDLSPEDRKAVRRALEFKKHRSVKARIVAGDDAELLGESIKRRNIRAVVVENNRVVGAFKGGK